MSPRRHVWSEEPRRTSMLRAMFGSDEGLMEAIDRFEAWIGEHRIWSMEAPARLCLMGEHSDYVPWMETRGVTFASDAMRMRALVAPLEEPIIRLRSSMRGCDDVDHPLPPPGDPVRWLADLDARGEVTPHWSMGVKGAVERFGRSHDVVRGFAMLVDSDIPVASGASSSSALATLGLFAAAASNSVRLSEGEVALLASEGEWAVGTRGGAMDHLTMVHGKEGGCSVLDFRRGVVEGSSSVHPSLRFVAVSTTQSDKSREARDAFNEIVSVQRETIPNLGGEVLPETVMHEGREVRVADRAAFVEREQERVSAIIGPLAEGDAASIGACFDGSFEDTRELLGTHNEAIAAAAEGLRSVEGVAGVKLMGAGFGGLLLAVGDDSMVDAATELFGAERVSSHRPGAGVRTRSWSSMLPRPEEGTKVAAMFLCGGAGSRMKASGIETHKPLLPLLGTPSTRGVIDGFASARPDNEAIVVVVPPDRMREYERALAGLDVRIACQPTPLGTGDAVLHGLAAIPAGVQHLHVSFGTQPLVRAETVDATLAIHLTEGCGFTLATTICDSPYAPLLRDDEGRVCGSLETHLDGVDVPARGETNVGAYWIDLELCRTILESLHDDLHDPSQGKYRTGSGELGFPNEVVKWCLANDVPVEGVPCADPEELWGLKSAEDIERIEAEMVRRALHHA